MATGEPPQSPKNVTCKMYLNQNLSWKCGDHLGAMSPFNHWFCIISNLLHGIHGKARIPLFCMFDKLRSTDVYSLVNYIVYS